MDFPQRDHCNGPDDPAPARARLTGRFEEASSMTGCGRYRTEAFSRSTPLPMWTIRRSIAEG